MKTTIQTTEDNNHMKALLDEVNEILKGSGDLNKEKDRLGTIYEEMMYWENKENEQHEEYYRQISDMLKAMFKLDFSKRLSLGTPKSLVHFISLGLNMLNEELNAKAFPVKMFRALLEGLDLKKNTLLLVTNTEGFITFIHTNIDKPHFTEEALLGQSIAVLFKEDFKTIDSLFKKEGTLKSLEVNMAFDNTGSVLLRLVLPTMMDSFEGIAYVITIPEKK